jgi:hypothetical protein
MPAFRPSADAIEAWSSPIVAATTGGRHDVGNQDVTSSWYLRDTATHAGYPKRNAAKRAGAGESNLLNVLAIFCSFLREARDQTQAPLAD